MLYNLGEQNSIASQFLLELRDTKIQKDRMRFRKNMQRLGEIMAYEISRKLSYQKESIETPMGKMNAFTLKTQPVLMTILRAGIPYFQGFNNFFDHSDSGFIGVYRKENEEEIIINLEYLATPSLTNREVILIDPMLATGRSIIQTIDALMKHGTPSHIHIAVVIAAPEGIKFIEEKIKIPYTLWTCAIDEKLNHQFYIIPGLGDAGDLSFGEKL